MTEWAKINTWTQLTHLQLNSAEINGTSFITETSLLCELRIHERSWYHIEIQHQLDTIHDTYMTHTTARLQTLHITNRANHFIRYDHPHPVVIDILSCLHTTSFYHILRELHLHIEPFNQQHVMILITYPIPQLQSLMIASVMEAGVSTVPLQGVLDIVRVHHKLMFMCVGYASFHLQAAPRQHGLRTRLYQRWKQYRYGAEAVASEVLLHHDVFDAAHAGIPPSIASIHSAIWALRPGFVLDWKQHPNREWM
jgi:hypothetical protein